MFPSEPRSGDPRYNIPGFDLWAEPHLAIDTDPNTGPWWCVRFNREWLPLVVNALDTLRWEDVYVGDYDQQALNAQRGMQLIAMFLLGSLCGGDDVDFRPQPGDPCILEYSIDGGANWSVAFDFCACMRACGVFDAVNVNVVLDLLNETNVYIGDLQQLWDGTPGSIAPDGTYDMGPDDAIRDRAICAASTLYVDVAAEVIRELRQQEEDELTDIFRGIGEVLGLIAGALAVWIGAGAASAKIKALATFLFTTAAQLLLVDFLLGLDEEAVESEVVRQEVACHMANNLKGSTVTEAAFNSSLDGPYSFAHPSSEQLADAISQLIQEQDAYFAFLDLYQSGFEVEESGAQLPCACSDWTLEFDFTGGDSHGFGVEQGGQFAVGGIQTQDYDGGGCWYRLYVVRVEFDITANITQITHELGLDRGAGHCNPTSRGSRFTKDLLQFIDHDNLSSNDPVTHVWQGELATDHLLVHGVSDARGSQASLGGYAVGYKITISGTGPQPNVVPA